MEYIRFELGKGAQNHSQQLHVAIQAYEVTNIAFTIHHNLRSISESIPGGVSV